MEAKKNIDKTSFSETEEEIQKMIKDIAINLKEIKNLSDKTSKYADYFRKTIDELEKMNKHCNEIEDHVKNVFGRAILLSNKMAEYKQEEKN